MTPRWRAPAAADTLAFAAQDVFEAGLRHHHVANTAYPIRHQRVWAPYRVRPVERDRVAAAAWDDVSDLCLYVHVPFCETRCSFCEYTVVGREEQGEALAYVDLVLRELALYRERLDTRGRTLFGFDIGGGTPSFLPAEEIAKLVEAVRGSFRFSADSDLSIETTPRIAAAEPAKLVACLRSGIGRISMGVQIADPDLLRLLNRGANGALQHRRAVDNIRAAGFRRLNLDLMYGLAGQSEGSWRATLAHAVSLAPETITLYRMRYKGTRIAHQARLVTLPAVQRLASLASAVLADAGYAAPTGKTTYSRIPGDVGTSSYLARRVGEGMPYLGLGLGAQSMTHSTVAYNDGAASRSIAPYRAALARPRLPIQDLYDLPARQVMAKTCAVAFYFGAIERRAFLASFGRAVEDVFGDEIAFALDRGLLESSAEAFRLTAQGALAVNGVIALFLAPSVQLELLSSRPCEALGAVAPWSARAAAHV